MFSRRLTWEGLWIAGSDLTLAGFFAIFAARHAHAFLVDHSLSSLLLASKESLVIGFYLCRNPARRSCSCPYSWIVAFAGTFCPLLYYPVVPHENIVAANLLQLMGVVLQVGSLLSLRRSFGIIAANRGVRTNGMYSFVRHPLYASYVINDVGFVATNFSFFNLQTFVMATLLQVLRIFHEERVLLEDGEYVAYARRIRWRLIPGVF